MGGSTKMGNDDIHNLFLRKPKDRNAQNASKLLFICHPNDFDDYFNDITDEILEKATDNHISAVFFYINQEITFDFEEIKDILKNIQLIVVPVTWELLSTKNIFIDKIIPYALKKHIPVLPLLQDLELTTKYTKHFGNIQFLYDNPNDKTAIPYELKLNDFIKNTLVGDELRKRVQKAFEAYIFLSYRKKDRKIAQEIMHLIHKNDFCRDIAIWYDEFLTPGEDFNKSIKNAIQKSDLFAMVITPNIIEPNNYIIEHEYPMADSAQKTILPLEGVETDKEKLNKCYKNIPECTNVYNSTALSEALLRNISITAKEENSNSPEHNYLIGLAYLTGIDVEINHERGIELIKKAAEEDLPEAVTRMITIYQKGIGREVNYKECFYWSERLITIYKKLYPEYDSEGWIKIAQSLSNKLLVHIEAIDYLSLKSVAEDTIYYTKAVLEKSDLPLAFVLLIYAYIYLSEIEKQSIILNSAPDNLAQQIKLAFNNSLPPLLKAEKIIENYAKKHPENDCSSYQLNILLLIFLSYAELLDINNAKIYYDKRKSIAKEKNLHELEKTLDMEWLQLKKSHETDFNDPESIKSYFDFVIKYFNDNIKSVTKETAFTSFFPLAQFGSLLNLIDYSLLEEKFTNLFSTEYLLFIENAIYCYELIPKKQINNYTLSLFQQILDFGIKITKSLDDKEKCFQFKKLKVENAEKIYKRLDTVDNKRKYQSSLYSLSLSALRLQKLDDAYKYGMINQKIALEIADLKDSTVDDGNNLVDSLSLLQIYYSFIKDQEDEMVYARNAERIAQLVYKRYKNGSSLIGFARAEFNLAMLLYENGDKAEALQCITKCQSAYALIMSDFIKEIYLLAGKDCIREYCDVINLHAQILEENENFEAAIQERTLCYHLSKSDEFFSDITDSVTYELGCLHNWCQHAEDSRAFFKEYLQRMPHFPEDLKDLYCVSNARYLNECDSKNPDINELKLAKSGFEKLYSVNPDCDIFSIRLNEINELFKRLGIIN